MNFLCLFNSGFRQDFRKKNDKKLFLWTNLRYFAVFLHKKPKMTKKKFFHHFIIIKKKSQNNSEIKFRKIFFQNIPFSNELSWPEKQN